MATNVSIVRPSLLYTTEGVELGFTIVVIITLSKEECGHTYSRTYQFTVPVTMYEH